MMTNRTKAILGLSGVFILGLLCGGLALGLFVRDVVQERNRLRNPDGFREYFAEELSLNDTQKDSLRTELEAAYRDMADIRRQVEGEYREVLDTLAQHIAPMLTPAQRQLLNAQKERLLPKRETPLRAEEQLPSIEEIDRTVAQAPASTSHDTTSTSTAKEEERAKMEEGEKRGSSGGTGQAAVLSGSPGDSILSAETEEEQLPRVVAHLKKHLNLTEDQTNKIQDLVRKAVRRNSWIRQNFQDQPLVRGRRLIQSFKMLDRQVLELLTDDQATLYNATKRLRQKRMKERFGEE